MKRQQQEDKNFCDCDGAGICKHGNEHNPLACEEDNSFLKHNNLLCGHKARGIVPCAECVKEASK